MPVAVNHSMLVEAFQYAIEETRKDGIHVVDNVLDWRNNFGSRTNRINTLYGVSSHHTGGEISANRIVSYVRSLGTGSIRPEIGRALCNTSTVRAGVWPGSGPGQPTIVVLAANYTNTEGLGDQGALDELKDGDVDMSEFKPGGDDLYLNRYFLGDEAVGAYMDSSQVRAFVVFYSHLLWKLGLAADADRDGKFVPVLAHRELTRRKVDPARVNMDSLRQQMHDFINNRYYGGHKPAPAPEPVPTTDPLVVKTFNNPHTPLRVDGVWGSSTTRALQYVLKVKYNAWGLNGPLVVDGVIGRNTYRALQRLLNQEIKAGLAEDGIFGKATKRALQRYVGSSVDGIVGPATVKAMQNKINGGF